MSLDWSVASVKNWETVCRDEKGVQRPATYSIIMCSMCAGYANVTEKNYEKIFERIHIYERARGAIYKTDAQGPLYVTLQDVKNHIGLRLNASVKTEKQFMENLYRVLKEDAVAELKYAKRQMENPSES